MKTLVVRSGQFVRFLITAHPTYRFEELKKQFPPDVDLSQLTVTEVKAKDIKAQYANLAVSDGIWYKLTEEFEQYLASL